MMINTTFVGMSCSRNHSVLLSTSNNVIGFGANSHGQCSVYDCSKIKYARIIKKKEFGINVNDFVEKVIALFNNTIVIVDPYHKKYSTNHPKIDPKR